METAQRRRTADVLSTAESFKELLLPAPVLNGEATESSVTRLYTRNLQLCERNSGHLAKRARNSRSSGRAFVLSAFNVAAFESILERWTRLVGLQAAGM